MNTLFVAVFVLSIGSSYGFLLDSLPNVCKVEADCGVNMCCAFGKFCSPKLGANMPCEGRVGAILKCGCRDGLVCKVVRVVKGEIFGKKIYQEFKQCKAAGETVVPVEIPVGQPSTKRFLVNVVRKCDANSDCGIHRCCLNVMGGYKACVPTVPEYFPCNGRFNNCCRQGLVCRSLVNINTGIPDGDLNNILDMKVCQKPIPPPTPIVDES